MHLHDVIAKSATLWMASELSIVYSNFQWCIGVFFWPQLLVRNIRVKSFVSLVNKQKHLTNI